MLRLSFFAAIVLMTVAKSAWCASSPLFFDMKAGGGYSSNLSHSESGQTSQSDGFGTLRVAAGSMLDVSHRAGIYFNAAYSGTYYTEFTDLTEHQLIFSGGSGYRVLPPLRARLSLSYSWNFYGDSSRSGNTLYIPVGVDYIFPNVSSDVALTLTGQYAFINQTADIAVFERQAHQFTLGAALSGSRDRLGLDYTFEIGQDVFYRSQAQALVSRMSNTRGPSPRMVTTFGFSQEALREDTTTQMVAVAFRHRLWQGTSPMAGNPLLGVWGLYFNVGYLFADESADPDSAVSHTFYGSLELGF